MPDIDWRTQEGRYSFYPYLGITGNSVDLRKPTILSCPSTFRLLGSSANLTDLNRTYTINFHSVATVGGNVEGTVTRHATRLNQVPEPFRMAFLLEGHILAGGAAERKMDSGDVTPLWTKVGDVGFMAPHNQRASVVFLDGHVELLKAPDDFPLMSLSAANRRRTAFWGSLQ